MPTSPEQLPPLDSWTAIITAIIAGCAALLVPLNGFMKTWFEYRIERTKAEALRAEPAREISAQAGGALFDSMAIADLALAIKDLSTSIRAAMESSEAHHTDRMGAAIMRLSEAMDRWEEREQREFRPSRRTREHDHR